MSNPDGTENFVLKLQAFYREDSSKLPVGLNRAFPPIFQVNHLESVYFKIEFDRESDEENLLVVTTIEKSISSELHYSLTNFVCPGIASDDGLAEIDDDLARFTKDLQSELDAITTRVAHLIGWRHRMFGFPYRFESSLAHLRWGLPTDTLSMPPFLNNQYPLGLMWLPAPEIWSGNISFEKMVRIDAPLYYELLNDAVNSIDSNPKGSLIMFVASLETAIKHYIVAASPKSEWLIREIPSPPIHKLYTGYLRELPSLNTGLDQCLELPKDIAKKIQKFVADRNSVVHGKAVEISRSYLNELKTVSVEVIYYIDWLRGEDWAFEFIPSSLKALILSK